MDMISYGRKIIFVLSCACVLSILYTVYYREQVVNIRSHDFRLSITNIISCSKLMNGSESEQKTARKIRSRVNDSSSMFKTGSCEQFERSSGFSKHCVSEEERDLPIAFAILMYKDVEQTIRLLRAIYRPHNIYCIHVDAKSSNTSIFQPIEFISRCYDNVFLPYRRINVVYNSFKDLEPEIVCLRDLLKRNKKWKYFINLTGQEFPLKTNYELVKILQAYNGSNDIEKITQSDVYKSRYGSLKLPHNLKPIKGATHVVATRIFIEFAIESQIGKDLLRWIETNKPAYPGELFYATLGNNPQLHIPGTYIGDNDTRAKNYIRHKIWADGSDRRKCYGHYLRIVCVFGVGDLPGLIDSPAVFANKFVYDFEPVAYDCLEYWYLSKSSLECVRKRAFNTSMYKSAYWVKNVQ